jgi:hypothetical protein
MHNLPKNVQKRLVLPDSYNWWRTVFHLAWHFPRPFLGADRERLLKQDGIAGHSRTTETCVQLCGPASQQDLLPGLIYSRLEHDICTSSEAAIDVVLNELQNCPKMTPLGDVGMRSLTSEERAVFRRLRDDFERGAGMETMPGHVLETKLMKLTDSFVTPPATEWAGLKQGGCTERLLKLSRLNDIQEICQIRGMATGYFCDLAERAGQALPADLFPDRPILFDNIRPNQMGIPIGISGPDPVMSRGPIERWVGFVFATLKERWHPALRVQWLEGQLPAPLSHALATLDRNLFKASVLVIDLAGLAGDQFNGWELLRSAPVDHVAQLPPPATGLYVIALEPPTLDGTAPIWGKAVYVPRREHLVLVWENGCGVRVLHQLDTSGCLLMGCQREATWLPEGWEMDLFPTGWTLPHLELWFATRSTWPSWKIARTFRLDRIGARITPLRPANWSLTPN